MEVAIQNVYEKRLHHACAVADAAGVVHEGPAIYSGLKGGDEGFTGKNEHPFLLLALTLYVCPETD
jgi:hypothetical protein